MILILFNKINFLKEINLSFFSTFFLKVKLYDNTGDDMKMNLLIPIICAVLLGYLCASFIFNQYGVESLVFSEKGNIYFLQCGAYNTKEASAQPIKGINEKITVKEGNKYYSYIGMTSDVKIAEMIQEMYEEKGIDIYIKEIHLNNKDFLNELVQYDVLLENSDTLEEINSVLKTVLATYDEIILNS